MSRITAGGWKWHNSYNSREAAQESVDNVKKHGYKAKIIKKFSILLNRDQYQVYRTVDKIK